ncbi:hydrogenase subunit [Candidatus Woesearchaeota archaeon]|nr:hydrogenase subunit [Candidatus Woesearchaeota archaeon]
MNTLLLDGLVKILLVLVLVSAVFIITRRNLYSLFRSYSFQSALIALIAFFLYLQEWNKVLLFTAVLTLVSKSILIPKILKKVHGRMNDEQEVEFCYLQPSGSIFVSMTLIFLIHIIFSKILAGFTLNNLFFIGAVLGMSLTLIGMMTIFSRKKVVSKIIGYLVMENGVVLFSLFLSELPFLIEVFVLMDLIMLVIIAAILAVGIDSSIEQFHAKLNPFRAWFKRSDKQ